MRDDAGVDDILDDVWYSRDLPVLVEVARRVDAGEDVVGHVVVADATGLSPEDVCRAARSLGRKGLVVYDVDYEGAVDFRDVTGQAYTLTGLHPSGEDERDALVELLKQAADSEPDPEEKVRLRTAAHALGDVSGKVATGVLTTFINAHIPH
jgi:hypothetical protein